MVLHRSIVNEGRGWCQSAMGICAFGYISETYIVQWFSRDLYSIGGGVGSVCHGYMCILLYMKLIWCRGFSEIYAQLDGGWGQSEMGICAFFYI